MPDALQLLQTRRSIKLIELAGPPPSAAEIDTLLTVAPGPRPGKLVLALHRVRGRCEAGRRRRDRGRVHANLRGQFGMRKPSARLARAPLVNAVVSRAPRM
jgi:hypothetical protein